jgi:DNA-binding beta-propeller fold protein YncE
VAEGADVPLALADHDPASSRCPPDTCVAAVLGDALRRISVVGGRDGMSRSLGSVLGGSVTRFLGGSLRGVESGVIDTPGLRSPSNGMAVSRDGATLLVSDENDPHAVFAFSVADGSRLRVVGSTGNGPLQFRCPRQVCIASDDFVFVADLINNRVQVLTPTLDFHAFVGVGELARPAGVCANDDVVVVSESDTDRVSVFNRSDGALRHRIGSRGSDDGQLNCPCELCFMSGDRYIAVADCWNHRVSVFSVAGDFVRHVGVGVLCNPTGVACSAFDELVVTDTGNFRVVVFSASGDMLKTMGGVEFTGVAIHGGTVFAQDTIAEKCVVFT